MRCTEVWLCFPLLTALASAVACEPVPPTFDAGGFSAIQDEAGQPSPAAAEATATSDAQANPSAAAKPDAMAAALAHDAGSGQVRDAGILDAAAVDAASVVDASAQPDGSFDGSSGDAQSESCADGFARGDASLALRRIAPFTPSIEGVTVCPSGDVFVTVDGTDEIRRVPLDGGAPELYASLTGFQPAGITCDEHGRLFVAGFARRNGSAAPPILMVKEKGATALELPLPTGYESSGLNGIAAVPGVGVFASDTSGGGLLLTRELPDGGFETRLAASDLLGGNGIAYHAATHTLYLVLSFLPARVVSFKIAPDGSLGSPMQEGNSDLTTFFDGVAVDARGDLYVADYAGGKLLRARDGAALAELSDPASLAFRGGTLLITSYHLGDMTQEGGLYALELGVCGP